MTPEEGKTLAARVRDGLPWGVRQRLKAIHVMPHLHGGHLTIRVFCTPLTADDPEPFIYAAEEL